MFDHPLRIVNVAILGGRHVGKTTFMQKAKMTVPKQTEQVQLATEHGNFQFNLIEMHDDTDIAERRKLYATTNAAVIIFDWCKSEMRFNSAIEWYDDLNAAAIVSMPVIFIGKNYNQTHFYDPQYAFIDNHDDKEYYDWSSLDGANVLWPFFDIASAVESPESTMHIKSDTHMSDCSGLEQQPWDDIYYKPAFPGALQTKNIQKSKLFSSLKTVQPSVLQEKHGHVKLILGGTKLERVSLISELIKSDLFNANWIIFTKRFDHSYDNVAPGRGCSVEIQRVQQDAQLSLIHPSYTNFSIYTCIEELFKIDRRQASDFSRHSNSLPVNLVFDKSILQVLDFRSRTIRELFTNGRHHRITTVFTGSLDSWHLPKCLIGQVGHSIISKAEKTTLDKYLQHAYCNFFFGVFDDFVAFSRVFDMAQSADKWLVMDKTSAHHDCERCVFLVSKTKAAQQSKPRCVAPIKTSTLDEYLGLLSYTTEAGKPRLTLVVEDDVIIKSLLALDYNRQTKLVIIKSNDDRHCELITDECREWTNTTILERWDHSVVHLISATGETTILMMGVPTWLYTQQGTNGLFKLFNDHARVHIIVRAGIDELESLPILPAVTFLSQEAYGKRPQLTLDYCALHTRVSRESIRETLNELDGHKGSSAFNALLAVDRQTILNSNLSCLKY